MVRDLLAAIPEVEQAYAESSRDSLSVLVVVPDKNEDVQSKIFKAEAELIDAFPSLDIDFDVVFRCDREFRDIVSPSGVRLLPPR
ncbi:MAG: hypothetical protein DMG96_37775 [Acidobacteria bacterium]|nr:MAG: hypothetical protein DMG96_37775 [Acidobacteriota bacterium]